MDMAALTRLIWCLGVRSRQARADLRCCSNPQLRRRLERELDHLLGQITMVQRQSEVLAESFDSQAWELSLLQEVIRRAGAGFDPATIASSSPRKPG
jgi:hypothetical protein